jgi:1-phosphofructokinase
VAVTLGAAGAVVATSDAAWYVPAPTITAVSPVGSGDCTLAGMVMARSQGADWPTALRHGVACGSANALIPHAAHFDVTTYAQFLAMSPAHPID